MDDDKIPHIDKLKEELGAYEIDEFSMEKEDDERHLTVDEILEKLIEEKSISVPHAAKLHEKYEHMKEILEKVKGSETSFLHSAKKLTNELENKKSIISQSESTTTKSTVNDGSETGKLRQELLKAYNELALFEEREQAQEMLISKLKIEKELLQKESERNEKATEMRKFLNNAKEEQDEIKSDISMTNQKIGQMKEKIHELKEDLARKEDDLREIRRTEEDLQMEISNAKKEKEKFLKSQSDIETKIKIEQTNDAKRTNDYSELSERILGEEQSKRSLESKTLDGLQQVEKLQAKINIQNSRIDGILMKTNEEKVNREKLARDSEMLSLSLKHTEVEKKQGVEENSHARHECDQLNKTLKKKEHDIKMMVENMKNIRNHLDDLKFQKQTLEVKYKLDGTSKLSADEQFENRLNALRQETINLRRQLLKQDGITSNFSQQFELLLEAEDNLMYQQSNCRIESIELLRIGTIKSEERENKAREMRKAKEKLREAEETIHMKDAAIENLEKQMKLLNNRLSIFTEIYGNMKQERNKYVSRIQSAVQKTNEIKEKLKIKQNEIDISRSTLIHKDKQLQKTRMKLTHSLKMRDEVRSDIQKEIVIKGKLNENKDQVQIDIEKYSRLSNLLEKQFVQLREKYDEGNKSRNKLSVDFAKRNQEFVVLNEKFNILESKISEAEMSMQARESEIKFLDLMKKDDERQIDILHNRLSCNKDVGHELTGKQIQLSIIKDKISKMNEKIENNPAVRYIDKEKTIDITNVMKKIEGLEIERTNKERLLLEKEFMLQQIYLMTSAMEKDVEKCRNNSLKTAKTVNKDGQELREITKRIMSKVAEIAMIKAQSFVIEHSADKLRKEVEEAYRNYEMNEAPTKKIEKEWIQFNRINRMTIGQSIDFSKEFIDFYEMKDGTFTTAEPRPTAYECVTNELPLSKPYGALAPFKPQSNGANIRHIRKPNIPSIEI
ncbi:hypothetical protein SNEBB_009761 [Seison nebaliae]|nr:hypothetical protein SNEBB_009761 [Seison nebaliae]